MAVRQNSFVIFPKDEFGNLQTDLPVVGIGDRFTVRLSKTTDQNVVIDAATAKVSHGLQLQSLWRIPTVAAS